MTKTNKDSNNRERLIVLEESVSYIRRDINEVKQRLNDFIETADNRYATKEEVYHLRNKIKRDNDISRSWIQWVVPLIISALLLAMEALKIYANG